MQITDQHTKLDLLMMDGSAPFNGLKNIFDLQEQLN